MKINLVKVMTAFLLGTVIAAVNVTVASGTQGGMIIGENDVNNVVVSVVTPSNLDFTIDPLELKSIEGSQIADNDYFFINKSEVPVKVSIEIIATLKEGISFVNDTSELARDDVDAKDKKIYFAILGADDLEISDLSFDNVTGHEAKGIYDASSEKLIPFDAESQTAYIEFVLAPAFESMPGVSGIDTLAEDNNGVFAFQFYSELNTYANWLNYDITILANYSIVPLRISDYENFLK